MVFSRGGVVSTSPNPQAGGPPLVGCPRLLIQYIRSYPPYRRPFLQPQPEDAPCRGDRDPLITLKFLQTNFCYFVASHTTICICQLYSHPNKHIVFNYHRSSHGVSFGMHWC